MNFAHPVWVIFSRRTFSTLAYWLSSLGYNLRDKSASNLWYLVYFVVFWLLWVVAVFALLGSGLAPLLRTFSNGSPTETIIEILLYGLGMWWVYWMVNAGKRSPFVFPEEDAYLLCQTPVSRSAVALAWFAQSWFANAIPLAAVTGVLSFALVESSITGPIILPTILVYIRHSLLAVLLVLPLQMTLQASAWTIGAWRLQYKRPPIWFVLIPLPLTIWIIADRVLNLTFNLPMGSLLPFIHWPLKIAFVRNTSIEWFGLFFYSIVVLSLSLWLLARTAKKMSLSRAAQETTTYAAIQTARMLNQFELADTIAARQRFIASPPSHLLIRSAAINILIGKDLQQILRSFTPLRIINWLLLIPLTVSIFIPGNYAIQGFSTLFWVVTFSGLATRRLRSDLARWWIIRSTPMRIERILFGELALSCLFAVLVGWVGLFFLFWLPWDFRIICFLCLPFITASVALSAANDIFRRSKARTLMSPSIGEENVPSVNLWGIIGGFVSAAIPLISISWSIMNPGQVMWQYFALPISISLAAINAQTAINSYEHIE